MYSAHHQLDYFSCFARRLVTKPLLVQSAWLAKKVLRNTTLHNWSISSVINEWVSSYLFAWPYNFTGMIWNNTGLELWWLLWQTNRLSWAFCGMDAWLLLVCATFWPRLLCKSGWWLRSHSSIVHLIFFWHVKVWWPFLKHEKHTFACFTNTQRSFTETDKNFV